MIWNEGTEYKKLRLRITDGWMYFRCHRDFDLAKVTLHWIQWKPFTGEDELYSR